MRPGSKMFLVMILFATTLVRAQSSDEPTIKRFAILAGFNTSNMNFNKAFFPPAMHIGASWRTGFTIGALIHVPLAQNLFLQPEYYFTQRKGADKSVSANFSVGYISMPLLLNYRLNSFLSVVAGPQAELLIRARQSQYGIDTSITHYMEERSIGATAGFDIEIKNYLIISARYMMGLNHIGISREVYLREFKYEVVRLTAGVSF